MTTQPLIKGTALIITIAFSIIGIISAFVGLGIWVGKIQTTMGNLKTDVGQLKGDPTLEEILKDAKEELKKEADRLEKQLKSVPFPSQ